MHINYSIMFRLFYEAFRRVKSVIPLSGAKSLIELLLIFKLMIFLHSLNGSMEFNFCPLMSNINMVSNENFPLIVLNIAPVSFPLSWNGLTIF